MIFENNSKVIETYVILTVYTENSITNSACVAKISIYARTLQQSTLFTKESMGLIMRDFDQIRISLLMVHGNYL